MNSKEKEQIEKLRQDGKELVENVLKNASKEEKREALMFICGFEAASLLAEKTG